MAGFTENRRIITLTTDFGMRDPFVAMMKGEILKINPNANIVDLTHGIEPGDVVQAAVAMRMAAKHFPPAAIHVCVVDPGVGSKRRPIMVITDDHYFIGPDNGVFSMIFDTGVQMLKVFELTQSHFFAPVISSVFHGRDIFAPVAGWMSKGVESSKMGEIITDPVRLNIPKPKIAGNMLEGSVIYSDHFGNTSTNITREHVDELRAATPGAKGRLQVAGKTLDGMSEFFAQKNQGEAGFLINSSDLVEIFINRGSAQKSMGLKPGDRVLLEWAQAG
ncbi:MAG: SAM-dependent chlorinase/fluorinase [Nitrospirae bacterium]|nr:SAM-dependent chlorinase/fluorinase [Nitrospirota bacterium]